MTIQIRKSTDPDNDTVAYLTGGRLIGLADLEDLIDPFGPAGQDKVLVIEHLGPISFKTIQEVSAAASGVGFTHLDFSPLPQPKSAAQMLPIEKKLSQIIIPSIEFAGTPLADALEFLKARSQELDLAEPDPSKRGVNIVVSSSTANNPAITLKLTNVPLREALRYVAALAGRELIVEPEAVLIN